MEYSVLRSGFKVLIALIYLTTVSAELNWDNLDLQQVAAPLHVHFKPSNESLVLDRLFKGHAISESRITSLLDILKRTKRVFAGSNCQSDVSLLLNISSVFLKYVDATSKIPIGILQGKWNWMGDYQECYDIEPVYNSVTGKSFKGKYSSAVLLLNGKPIFSETSTVILGVCLPDSCSPVDSRTLLNEALTYMKFIAAKIYPDVAKETLSVYEVFPDEKPSLGRGAIVVIVITGIIFAIVLFSTCVDYLSTLVKKENDENFSQTRYDVNFDDTDQTELLAGTSTSIQDNRSTIVKKKLMDICRAFSITSNSKKLFGTETAVGPLACLNGLRVLSMWWVILGHTYFFATPVADNIVEGAKLVRRFTFQPIINGTYSVDSFFFLSGLLVAYLAFKQIREKGNMSWPYYFLHRYWRLTPVYAYVIIYFIYIHHHTITGPFSYIINSPEFINARDKCKSYWWTNLLYINNMYPDYGNIGTTCLGWSWYLANDMQFYLVLGPVVILTLGLNGGRKYLIGVFVTVCLIVAGIVLRGVFVWYYGIYSLVGPATKHLDSPWAKNNPLYDKPYARWSVYLVGMLTGYVLAVRNNRIKINKIVAMFGWVVAIATGLAVVYGQYYYNRHTGTHMTLVESGFYIALGRTAWGLCLSWVVLACVSGNGGPVKEVLSWKLWAPLGRLTYAAYLIHPLILMSVYYNMRQSLHISDLTMIYLFISNLVLSYLFAFILSMLVEAPMIQLEKLLLSPLSSFSTRFVKEPIVLLVGKVRTRFVRSS